MGSIYSKEICTLIGSGLDGDARSQAWSLIDEIYTVYRREIHESPFRTNTLFAMYAGDDHNDHGLPAWSEVRWNLLARPLKEERFTRVWFILEVALSQVDPVIIRGRQQYGWDRFACAAFWL
ncbi:hypothetical protein BDV23DRAFT_178412 [Aspergillus alliaceus]|uniref:Uncharacterized protein n=1 Tax=Petromyces alliaceus TaxID=209559 RepID=A0A5N7CQP1_PETAA|nr:hypothetical protein BDV23DRAFT_178412 [Aspergillus alliaceus]